MKYSVVVAFKDEIGYIEKMLETLINQSLAPQEVILVNDSSSDGSEKAVQQIIKDHKNFRVINNISIDSYEPGKRLLRVSYLDMKVLKKNMIS